MKTKAVISFRVTAKLVCAFDLAYVNCWFSDAVAQIMIHVIYGYNLKDLLSVLQNVVVAT